MGSLSLKVPYTDYGVLSMKKLLPLYVFVMALFIGISFLIDKGVAVFSEASVIKDRTCVIIDAGHGGEDGGSTSITGVLESRYNLEIALKLEDLCHLLGMETKMIRRTDISVYTQGDTISARKHSDLKQRVHMINETSNAFLVSIHQNTFSDSVYRGAQVFYSPKTGSENFANQLQAALVSTVNPGSNRKAKKTDGIYLLDHIQWPGVLVECGFISNQEDARLLSDTEYQNNICAVIAATLSSFLNP